MCMPFSEADVRTYLTTLGQAIKNVTLNPVHQQLIVKTLHIMHHKQSIDRFDQILQTAKDVLCHRLKKAYPESHLASLLSDKALENKMLSLNLYVPELIDHLTAKAWSV